MTSKEFCHQLRGAAMLDIKTANKAARAIGESKLVTVYEGGDGDLWYSTPDFVIVNITGVREALKHRTLMKLRNYGKKSNDLLHRILNEPEIPAGKICPCCGKRARNP